MNWWIRIKRKALQAYVKAMREEAEPEFIARGWAIGVFYGCLIPFGFQLFFSIPTALCLRGSRLGSILGTFISNHFSIFFIYPVQCYVGLRLLGDKRSYMVIEKSLAGLLKARDWQALTSLGEELIFAFFIGGAIFAIVMTPLTYHGILALVRHHRIRVARKAARRAHARVKA